MIDYNKINKDFKIATEAYRELLSLDGFKDCFVCHDVLPLDMFEKNTKKYQNASQKGHAFVCRSCNSARLA
jgi:hypothetical protein